MIRHSLALLLAFQIFNCVASDAKKKAVILVPVEKSQRLLGRVAKQSQSKPTLVSTDLTAFVMSQCAMQLQCGYKAFCARQRAEADAILPGSGKHLMILTNYEQFCAIAIRKVQKQSLKKVHGTGILAIDAR